MLMIVVGVWMLVRTGFDSIYRVAGSLSIVAMGIVFSSYCITGRAWGIIDKD